MEEYLKVIFLATPGFIAQRVALWFGNGSTNKSTFDNVMTYAVYSLVCISVSLLVITYTCIYPGINLNANINHLLQIEPTLQQILKTSTCIIAVSSLTGTIWQLVIKKFLKKAIVWTSLKLQNYIPVSDEMYLESYFKDLKKHTLISVKRNDHQILLGKYLGSSFEDDNPVINVDERSDQIKQWKQAGYDFEVNDRLYLPNYDMLIEIYQVPDHFFGD